MRLLLWLAGLLLLVAGFAPAPRARGEVVPVPRLHVVRDYPSLVEAFATAEDGDSILITGAGRAGIWLLQEAKENCFENNRIELSSGVPVLADEAGEGNRFGSCD